ncbi:MAG: hypothetical protein UY92_C0011G0069 [Candidatus Magasanikbacteria bacterium GW2011_GWA2_56_11]|uniref:Uncharacterized protein n=1 Tax=Candidatus Magasanikbacteria bacterium GW2011_GWA2_56_11 TaxID=1619044 RepID=A0A0G2AL83_9BACT|nr:MAG: hypothetical protein UY92_C0011G0069 [Candidatus Magasanikbacteria bacterium GW2011_GWA2_56_11]
MRSPYRKVVGHCLRNSFAYPWQRTPCPPWVIGPWRRSLRLFERTLADARLTLAGGRTEQAPAGPRRENALAVIDMVEALGDTAWSAPPAVIPESRLKSSDSTRLRQVLGLAAKDYRLKLEPDHSSSIPGSRRIAVEAVTPVRESAGAGRVQAGNEPGAARGSLLSMRVPAVALVRAEEPAPTSLLLGWFMF